MPASFPTVLSLPAFQWCMGLATLTGLALCGVPLLGTHGVESALVLGVVLPVLSGLLSARVVLAARRRDLAFRNSADLLLNIALCGALLWALPTCVLALNALRMRQCDPWAGVAFMLLGPGVGTLLAALVGTAMSMLSDRGALVTALGMAAPIAALVLWGASFYNTPAVFAFGHFFGYFPGSFYDRLVPLPSRLIDLRFASLSLGLGIIWLLLAQLDARDWRIHMTTRSVGLSLAGLTALSAGLLATVMGEELGLSTSHRRLSKRLGGYVQSARCELYVPREMKHKERFGHDCDVRVVQAERFFGLRLARRLRVYVFRSASEKRVYMGAASTNIAKPWRNEIYLQEDTWPHPVLAHEVAHVIIGKAGMGPFRITGAAWGLWPNPGLVEGMAVAADFHPASGLTPHQWARAMLDLEMIPPLEKLLGPGFFGHQARLAYTLTGSFLRFVYERHGSDALQRIYRTGDVAGAMGRPLAELETAWRARLSEVELSNEGLALARLRFSGKGLFSAVCPHRVAELEAELGQDLSAGDDTAARSTCETILATDPSQTDTRTRYIGVLARLGNLAAAREQLALIERVEADNPAAIAHARHTLADEAFRSGDYEAARDTYHALMEMPQPPEMLRLVQVKAFGLDGSRKQAQFIFDFLVGDGPDSTDGATAVHLMRELRAVRHDGLARYLEGRQLFFRNRFDLATPLFGDARALGLPTEELTLEALRIHAVSAYASGDLVTAKHLFRQLAETGPPDLKWEAADWLSRMEIRATLND